MATTYYVNGLTGDDDLNDGLSEGSPFKTIQKAETTRAAYDTIYVKASVIYTEEVSLYTGGFYLTGYSDTPGDGGMITIDGENTRNYGITDGTSNRGGSIYINIRITRCLGLGFYIAESDNTRVINCQADNNGAGGIDVDDNSEIIGCRAYNNSNVGIKVQWRSLAIGCICNNNLVGGIIVESGECIDCIAIQNTNIGIFMGIKTEVSSVIGCTVDGIDKTTNLGISFNGQETSKYIRVINNIVVNCVTGISNIALMVDRNTVNLSNLLYGNTTNYNNFMASEYGEVLADPQFINASGLDVTPDATSPAKTAGFGPKIFPWSSGLFTGDNPDIGAIQAEAGIATITYIDRTIHEFIYHPESSLAIIGELDSGEDVNIQLWSNGISVNITVSGCSEVNSTGKYIWLLNNLPPILAGSVQYQWRMSDGSNVVNGDFILHTTEGKDGGMPLIGDDGSYIISN